MNYHFDIDEAKKFGVNEAIFISNLRYWVFYNRANGKHFHDNRTWSYNSQEAFTKLFPFWTRQAIRTITTNLINFNIIVTGNYHEDPFNKSLWYAFADEQKFLGLVKNNQCSGNAGCSDDTSLEPSVPYIGGNQPMHGLESTNVITNNKLTNNKQDIKKEKIYKKEKRQKSKDDPDRKPTEKELEPFWLEFYDEYPVKKAPRKAKEAFVKSCDFDGMGEIIIDAIKAQKRERALYEKHNVDIAPWKYPATWLNQGCFEDYVHSEGEIKKMKKRMGRF